MAESWLTISRRLVVSRERQFRVDSNLGEGIFGCVFRLENCVALSALRNRRPQLRNFVFRCKRGAAAFMGSFGPFR